MSQKALNKYTEAMRAMKAHQEANQAVFDGHKRLLFAVIDAEGQLKDSVAESGEDVANDEYKVTIEKQTMTIYDDAKLRAALSSNPAALNGIITVQQRPPRITIREQK